MVALKAQKLLTYEELFDPKGDLKKPSAFKIGEVYEFLPTFASRFQVSFFSEIIFIDEPGKQVICYMPSIKIDGINDLGFGSYTIHSNNWLTNINRMKLAGMKKDVGYLLKNEQLKNPKTDGFKNHKSVERYHVNYEAKQKDLNEYGVCCEDKLGNRVDPTTIKFHNGILSIFNKRK